MPRGASRILDEYLVAAARAGNHAALNKLAARWRFKLFSHACRLTADTEMAAEAVQDAWVDVAKGISGLRDTATFPAWIYRIVSRRCVDQIRKTQRLRKLRKVVDAENKNHPISTQIESDISDYGTLRIAIGKLPIEQKTVISLHYQDELSIAEIAAVLSIPSGTVKTRLMNARRALRAEMEKRKS